MQQDPATRVSAPAIGLIVTGGVGIAATVVWMLLASIGVVAALADANSRDALPGIGVWIGGGVISLALSALVAYAGWQMRQLKGWSLSMAGAVIAMLPCSGCCILGLPIGIWAIMVLVDQSVKAAFNGGGGGPTGGYGGPGGGFGGPGSGYGGPAGPGGYDAQGGQGGGDGGPGSGYGGQGNPPQA